MFNNYSTNSPSTAQRRDPSVYASVAAKTAGIAGLVAIRRVNGSHGLHGINGWWL